MGLVRPRSCVGCNVSRLPVGNLPMKLQDPRNPIAIDTFRAVVEFVVMLLGYLLGIGGIAYILWSIVHSNEPVIIAK